MCGPAIGVALALAACTAGPAPAGERPGPVAGSTVAGPAAVSLAAPLVRLEVADSSTVRLSWPAVAGAAGYDVYRSAPSGDTWVAWSSEPSAVLGGLVADEQVCFVVVAGDRAAGVWSPRSERVCATPALGTPVETVPPAAPVPSVAPDVARRAGFDRLVFADVFAGSTLSATWTPGYWWWDGVKSTNVANGNFNWYVPEQVAVTGGSLRLTAERRPFEGKPYVSGLVTSHQRQAFTYGHVEARIRVPVGTALWGAFWMGAESRAWPPEIDIMEMPNTKGRPGRGYATYFWGDGEMDATPFSVPDPGGWHTWSLTWSPGELVWYLDGREVKRATRNVPAEPMYLLLNLAVGSNQRDFAGPPDASTPATATMEVDWVRVWGR
jgi:beta-glucanase (GH16 family)